MLQSNCNVHAYQFFNLSGTTFRDHTKPDSFLHISSNDYVAESTKFRPIMVTFAIPKITSWCSVMYDVTLIRRSNCSDTVTSELVKKSRGSNVRLRTAVNYIYPTLPVCSDDDFYITVIDDDIICLSNY